MAGIGETLRAERRRQRRTLADAAAETRVRESYLAAIEQEEFAALGGDVYARGFIRLYARYLGLDAEALVAVYRDEHEHPEEITAIPGATFDDILPPMGGPRVRHAPVFAALGVVLVLVTLFFFGRSRGGGEPTDDPSAPGPAPTEVAAADGQAADPLATPTDGVTEATLSGVSPLPPADAEPLSGPLTVEILPARDVRVRVLQGQPPIDGTFGEGQGRVVTAEDVIVFQLGDATAAEIRVNGESLISLGAPGQPVEVRCEVGTVGCEVRDV